jgi:hypothetical protein
VWKEKRGQLYVGFEDLVMVTMKIPVLWVVTPYNVVQSKPSKIPAKAGDKLFPGLLVYL